MPVLGEIKRGREIGRISKNCASRQYVWHACVGCGKERWVDVIKRKPRSTICLVCSLKSPERRSACSKRFYGAGHPQWKGGRTQRRDGYVEVWIPDDDFFYPMTYGFQSNGKSRRNYIPEHRLVMARHLNRCLLPWEVVHHRGTKYPIGSKEDKSDNRLENLELLPSGKSHLPDMVVKSYLVRLQKKIAKLEAENKILRERLALNERK